MGFMDGWDSQSVISRKSHHSSKHHGSSSKRRSKSGSVFLRPKSKSRSRSRSRSRARSPGARSIAASIFGGDDDRHRHSRHDNRSSFFGLPNVSTRSFFGMDKHRSSTSSYRRSPRPNFLARAYKQLKRLLRDLVYYAKRHPVKVFSLVVLPLLTGGALTALLARFGLRLPPSIERMLGVGARAMSGGGAGLVGEAVRMASGMGSDGGRVSLQRGYDDGLQWERRSWERDSHGGGWSNGLMNTVRDWF
ncbi:hypothetical protein KVR01_005689 [Diaporthe batatas]|uniref:uncharacterized protein n=1 Tax=Diaporthe batatas TaxID=748121 RepID=UPI001D04002F|nr:uncharacterized protein KVR01_005689 [Diaporthe batatas]KAG8165414.1 hypothetical protein KVR01_005689 [Diaporthe batatas]